MGRPKTYDPDVIAERAMEVFWLHGFHGTSTQQLVDHMRVNRFSLYAEFGSKEALYQAAVARYEKVVVARNLGPLEAPGAGFPDIAGFIKMFAASARGPGSDHGCLICNAATERGPHDGASQRFVEAYVLRLAKAFRHALENERRHQRLRPGVNTADEGRLLATTLLGFFVLLRAQVDPKVIQGAARVALAHVASLSSSPLV